MRIQRAQLKPADRDHPGRSGSALSGAQSLVRPDRTAAACKAAVRCGFTLIELVLVMALIVIVISLVTPRLKSFFEGRALDSEARRFMTLTRYGQSRAVAEGVPMLVWIDEDQRQYGLQAQPGYLTRDDKAVEYTLASDLKIEIRASFSTYTTTETQTLLRNLPTNRRYIRFAPDGFLGEASPEYIFIRQGEKDAVAIGQNRSGQSYEISTNTVLALR